MSRALTAGEVALARSVFGEAIAYGRVRIANRRWGRPAIAFGSRITFPPRHPAPADFSRQPIALQAWFIHEMVHVWQFQGGAARTLASWLLTVLRGGYRRGGPGYRYRLPLGDWRRYNLEQQASMVEHAFVLRQLGTCAAAPEGVTLAAYRACVPFLD